MQGNLINRRRGFRRTLACAMALALCIPFAHAHAPQAAPIDAAATPGVALEGKLEFYDRKASPSDLGGWYADAGSLVAFRVESWTAGTKSAVGDVPDKVSIRLEINGAVVDHEFDYAAQTVTIDGHDTKLAAADVAVLRSFYLTIEKSLVETAMAESGVAARDVTLPRAQDALNRLATMYSEAPLGKVLGQRVVAAPKVSYASPDKPGGVVLGHAPFSTEPPMLDAKCQQGGGDGLTYLYEPCNTVRYRNTWHDANHCYTYTNEAYGENQSSCQGRCGVGCGAFGGWGTWSVDCHDHDMCSTYHSDGCGDEWDEAADDYLNGWPVC